MNDKVGGEGSEIEEVASAPDESLDAFLSGDADDSDVEETTEKESETPTEAASSDTPEQENSEAPTEKQAKSQEDDRDAQIERLKQQRDQAERFIQQLKSENGQHRKQLSELKEKLQKQLSDEAFLESPTTALKTQRDLERVEGEIERLDAEDRNLDLRHQFATTLTSHVKPEYGVGWNEMAETLKADGVGNEHVAQFISDPVAYLGDPVRAVLLYKRTVERKAGRELLELATSQAKRIAELEKQLKEAPTKVVNSFNSALKSSPSVTGKNQGSTGAKRSVDVSSMSDEELNAVLGLN